MNENINLKPSPETDNPNTGNQELTRGVAGGVAIMMGGKGILLTMGFVTKILMVRFLGPVNLGAYGLFTYICAIAAGVANMGIPNVHTHDVGKDPKNTGSAAGFSLVYTATAGILATLIFYLVFRLWLYDLYFAKITAFGFLFTFTIIAVVPAFILRQQLNAINLGLKRFKSYNAVLLLDGISILILFLVFSRWFSHPLSAAVAAWISALLISTLLILIMIISRFHASLKFPLSRLRHFVSFGSKAFLTGLIHSLTLRANLFIVGYFLAPEEVGFFFLASSLAIMCNRIVVPVARVFFSYAAGLSFEDAVKMINAAFRFFLFGGILACILLAPLVYFAIPIVFGAEYAASIPVMLILLPSIVILILIEILYAFFIARGVHGKVISAYIIIFLANCTLSVALIPFLGIEGAALALTGANIIGVAVIIQRYKKITQSSIQSLLKFSLEDFRQIKKIILERKPAKKQTKTTIYS